MSSESTIDPKWQKVMDALRISDEYCKEYFEDALDAIDLYDNVIDERIWATISECPIPSAYAFVETMLPTIKDYLFGNSKPFAYSPLEVAIPNEVLDKLEKFAHSKLFNEIDFKHKITPALRDALVLNCAYAIVEPKLVTPPTVQAGAVTDGQQFDSRLIIAPSEPVQTIDVRILDFFSVFPAPSATTPEDADWVIIIDFMPDSTIKRMLDSKILKGNFDQMKIDARGSSAYANDALTYARQVSNRYTEEKRDFTQNEAYNHDLPVRIPVIKYYGKDEHIWVSGNQVIYNKKDKDILGNPLVRLCSQQVRDQWFPKSPVQYASEMFNLINAWYNSILDVMGYYLYPVTIANKNFVDTSDVTYAPNKVIETTGDPNSSVQYQVPPPLPPAMLEYPREIRGLTEGVTGIPEVVRGQGGAGMVRGGTGALESLLQTASARVLSMAEEIERSGIKKIYEKATYLLQMIGEGGQVTLVDDKNNKSVATVTGDEMRQALGVEVLSKKRMLNKMADQALKLQLVPMLQQAGANILDISSWIFPDDDLEELVGQQGLLPPEQQAMLAQGGGQSRGQGEPQGRGAPQVNVR